MCDILKTVSKNSAGQAGTATVTVVRTLALTLGLLGVARAETDSPKETAESAGSKEQAVAAAGPVVKLEPYVINELPPKLCFGVSLSVWENANTGKVMAIYINKVKAQSDAEAAGFGPRTRIYRINGNPVEEMSASFNGDSELNRIFINRKIGEKITVEAVPEGGTTSKTVTLMERSNVGVEFKSGKSKSKQRKLGFEWTPW